MGFIQTVKFVIYSQHHIAKAEGLIQEVNWLWQCGKNLEKFLFFHPCNFYFFCQQVLTLFTYQANSVWMDSGYRVWKTGPRFRWSASTLGTWTCLCLMARGSSKWMQIFTRWALPLTCVQWMNMVWNLTDAGHIQWQATTVSMIMLD